MTTANLSYPIGEYQPRESVSKELKEEWIQALEEVPAKLMQAVEGLTTSQLDTPYRDGDGPFAKLFIIWLTVI